METGEILLKVNTGAMPARRNMILHRIIKCTHKKWFIVGKHRKIVKISAVALSCLILLQLGSIVEYIESSNLYRRSAGDLKSDNRHDTSRRIRSYRVTSTNHVEDGVLCPLTSPYLVGNVTVNQTVLPWDRLYSIHSGMLIGGRHLVTDCISRHHVAIVIPYRDRDEHLRIFLNHMIPILSRQQLNFGIYVIEQLNGSDFNRGMLMNIGFVEALMMEDYACFIFTDVDLLLENDMNIYGCPDQPRHMSVAIDTLNYTLMYEEMFGGVENFRTEQFESVNGFSNQYFGWGAEDDDLRNRVLKRGMYITRPPADVARYTMAKHEKEKASESRFDYLKTSILRYEEDGLNSLQYTVDNIHQTKLFTKIAVHIDQAAISKEPGNCTLPTPGPNQTPDPMQICT